MAYSTITTPVTGTTISTTAFGIKVKDNFDAAFPLGVDAWTSWTPTLTNLTLGNGVRTAKYQRVGRTIRFRFKIVFGTTSAMGSNPSFSLPVAAHADYVNLQEPIGSVCITDTGTTNWLGYAFAQGSSCGLYSVNAADNLAVMSSTVPMTWANTDVLAVTGQYESAT